MTVSELRDLLAQFPDCLPVVVEIFDVDYDEYVLEPLNSDASVEIASRGTFHYARDDNGQQVLRIGVGFE